MICTECGHDNRPGAKFCEECAAPLIRRCASCGSELRPTAKFCDECGAALQVSGIGTLVSAAAIPSGPVLDVASRVSESDNEHLAPETRTALASYTPEHGGDRILQSKSALEGEQKQVTVLFADVRGSDDLAEQIDCTEWHAILDRYFQILTDGVHRFEGTVNEYIGDGIIALFGVPIPHEDHAQRACFAALALRDALRDFARDVKRCHGLDFATRFGLNSGEVVVGTISDDLRMEDTAHGHTVGLAQRVGALASGDSIYVSPHTWNLARGNFSLEDVGEFTLKGAPEPMHVYELKGVSGTQTRFDFSRARRLVRFVGPNAGRNNGTVEEAVKIEVLKPEDRPAESRYGGANLLYQGRYARVCAKQLPFVALQVYGKVVWDSDAGKAKWQPNEHVILQAVRGGYAEILRW